MKSVLDKKVSYFQYCHHKLGKDVKLLTLLQSDKLHIEQRNRIMRLRSNTSDEQRETEKKQLSCYTVAGRFNPCTEDGLVELSGLACFDFDEAEGRDIPYLLKILKENKHIAYAGFSCSGKRLFGIVPFLYPEKYAQHYASFVKTFKELVGMSLDTCHRSLCQVRFISLNEPHTEFFNHSAEPYGQMEEKRYYTALKASPSPALEGPIDWDRAFDWVVEMIRRDGDYTDGNRHNFIRRVAYRANQKGIPKEYALSGCLRHFECERKSSQEIESLVESIYRIHRDKHNSKPYKQLT